MNVVVLNGRLTRNPELNYTYSNQSVCNFTIAVDRNLSSEKAQEYANKNLPTADYIRITAWGKTAENVTNYLFKGSPVLVHGRIQTNSYKDENGKDVYTTDVVASNVEFLETRQQADARRNSAPQQQNQGGYQQQNYQQQPQQQNNYQQAQGGYGQQPQPQNYQQNQGGYQQPPQQTQGNYGQQQNYQQQPQQQNYQQNQGNYGQSGDFVSTNDDFVEIEDDGRIPF